MKPVKFVIPTKKTETKLNADKASNSEVSSAIVKPEISEKFLAIPFCAASEANKMIGLTDDEKLKMYGGENENSANVTDGKIFKNMASDVVLCDAEFSTPELKKPKLEVVEPYQEKSDSETDTQLRTESNDTGNMVKLGFSKSDSAGDTQNLKKFEGAMNLVKGECSKNSRAVDNKELTNLKNANDDSAEKTQKYEENDRLSIVKRLLSKKASERDTQKLKCANDNLASSRNLYGDNLLRNENVFADIRKNESKAGSDLVKRILSQRLFTSDSQKSDDDLVKGKRQNDDSKVDVLKLEGFLAEESANGNLASSRNLRGDNLLRNENVFADIRKNENQAGSDLVKRILSQRLFTSDSQKSDDDLVKGKRQNDDSKVDVLKLEGFLAEESANDVLQRSNIARIQKLGGEVGKDKRQNNDSALGIEKNQKKNGDNLLKSERQNDIPAVGTPEYKKHKGDSLPKKKLFNLVNDEIELSQDEVELSQNEIELSQNEIELSQNEIELSQNEFATIIQTVKDSIIVKDNLGPYFADDIRKDNLSSYSADSAQSSQISESVLELPKCGFVSVIRKAEGVKDKQLFGCTGDSQKDNLLNDYAVVNRKDNLLSDSVGSKQKDNLANNYGVVNKKDNLLSDSVGSKQKDNLANNYAVVNRKDNLLSDSVGSKQTNNLTNDSQGNNQKVNLVSDSMGDCQNDNPASDSAGDKQKDHQGSDSAGDKQKDHQGSDSAGDKQEDNLASDKQEDNLAGDRQKDNIARNYPSDNQKDKLAGDCVGDIQNDRPGSCPVGGSQILEKSENVRDTPENGVISRNDTQVNASSENSQGDVDPSSPILAGLSLKDKLAFVREKRNVGIWVQCCNKECEKWRYLRDVSDPLQVPEVWTCKMNRNERENSCLAAETRPTEDEENTLIHNAYNCGSLVWAKMKGSPAWPAMVDDDPDTLKYYYLEGYSSTPSYYHVVFFDTEVSRGWCRVEEVEPFDAATASLKVATMKRKLNPIYKKRLSLALKQATQAQSMDVTKRRIKYAFINRYEKAKQAGEKQFRKGMKSGKRKLDDLE